MPIFTKFSLPTNTIGVNNFNRYIELKLILSALRLIVYLLVRASLDNFTFVCKLWDEELPQQREEQLGGRPLGGVHCHQKVLRIKGCQPANYVQKNIF